MESKAGLLRASRRVVLVSVPLVFLAACSGLPSRLWPFGAKAAPPQAVDELVFEASGEGAAPPVAMPQYWKRNTLVVDLQSAPSSGSMRLRPKSEEGWPVRVAFRVRPGSFDRLEVRANQRVVLAIDGAATAPVDLELAPGVLSRRAPSMDVFWGPGSLTPNGPPIMDATPPAATATPQSPPGS